MSYPRTPLLALPSSIPSISPSKEGKLLTYGPHLEGPKRPTPQNRNRRRITGRRPRVLPPSQNPTSPPNAASAQRPLSVTSLNGGLFKPKSSVAVLPGEILALIVDHAYARSHSLSILKYSHVCRRWRAMVLSTPTLWTSVALPPYSADEEEIIRCVSEWVRRAGALPFGLTLDTQCLSHSASASILARLSASLPMERCAHLSLEPGFSDALLTPISYTTSPLGLQEAFQAKSPRVFIPTVHSLCISSNHSLSNFDFDLPASPTTQIRSLILSAPGFMPSFLSIMLACPVLEECTLVYDSGAWFDRENDWEVGALRQGCLPHLRKLTVVRPPVGTVIFAGLCLPVLRVVEVLQRVGGELAVVAELERGVQELCKASGVERSDVEVVYLTKEDWEMDMRNMDGKRRSGWGA